MPENIESENIEIKARLRTGQSAHIRTLVSRRAHKAIPCFAQTDTFFHAPNGRLKLRESDSGVAELIAYRRPDQPGPKHSRYVLAPVADPLAMRAALEMAFGVRGTVRKSREVFLVGQTRVHLGDVDGLGEFLELEVVLRSGQRFEDASRIAEDFLNEFAVPAESLIQGAYIDLLDAW